MSRARDFLDRLILRSIRRTGEPQIDEQPVLPVNVRGAQRLAVDRNNGLALLARRFRHQLLKPGTEIRDCWRADDSKLVATLIVGDAKDRAERNARILLRLCIDAARLHHVRRPRQQLFDIKPHYRRRHQPEIRQRGITPADAGNAGNDLTEMRLAREFFELGAGIGNGDEMLRCAFLVQPLTDARKEILHEDIRFERRAGFARDDEQCPSDIDFLFQCRDLRRIGRIEHEQPGISLGLPESHGQHFGAHAGPTHAKNHRVREALARYFASKVPQAGKFSLLSFDNGEPIKPLRFVRAGPQCGVTRPKALDQIRLAPCIELALARGSQPFRQMTKHML